MLTRPKYTKILKVAACFFIATTAIFLLANFALAADFWGGDTNGTGFANNAGLPGAGMDLRILIANIIRTVLGFLGIIAVILIIYGGFIWMTSAGDEQKIEQAKAILKNALIGLIIIILSFAIASFVLNLLAGATGGGQNGPASGPPSRYGLSALGNGIIQSHYPARDQKEVPRNTSIIISFREPILASTLCTNPQVQLDDQGNEDSSKPLKCTGKDTDATRKGNIKNEVMGIFKQSDEANCINTRDNSPISLSACSSWADAKVYSTSDNKTFVIVPINYLGSPSEYINYTVYLGKGLKRQTGELAFASGFGRDYGWSFEVSNKIDLDPPIVKPNGVFPSPDNARDTTVPGVGQQAQGTITVNSKPAIYSDAGVLSVVKVPADVPLSHDVATVDKNCSRNERLAINVDQNGVVKLSDSGGNLLGQGTVSGSGKIVSFPQVCNLRLTIDTGSFVAGKLWNVTVKPMVTADTITVGNITYTASNTEDIPKFNFEAISADIRDIADGIRNVLRNNPEVVASRGATRSTVKITAKLAGAAGNSINLSSSNSTRLPVVAMANGKDKVDNVTVNGKKDQPMNSAIQINFNEAIMPLTVSGTADEVKNFIRVVNAKDNSVAEGGICAVDADCQSFVCDNLKCIGSNNYLKGKFAISNQYSTVEFLSDKECGFNNCGEKIYCLPANSHLRVELKAAKLVNCGADNCASRSPFNTCDSAKPACKDVNNKYYPQADPAQLSTPDGGITDAAFNSLDGNRNDSSVGPVNYFNENFPFGRCEGGDNKREDCTEENKVTVCGKDIRCLMNGDNYKWSFFISNVLDLTPPKIKTTTPIINGVNVPLIDKITINFDKLMLSSRLTTGSLMIQNGKQNIQHYLLNLRSLADQPVGYWVTNLGQQSVPGSGEIDRTDAYINHSPFNKASTYKAQAGSGLKDIYQNCFLPCAGPACTGVDSQKPCCCNGTSAASCP